MIRCTTTTQVNYHDYFQSLLSLEESTPLFSLIGEEDENASSQKKPFIKALKLRIRRWANDLDYFLEEARQAPGQLNRLARTLRPLNERKIELLEEKIDGADIKNDTIGHEISRLKTLMNRMSNCLSSLDPHERLMQHAFEQLELTKKEREECEAVAESVWMHFPGSGKEWQESLLKAFKEITREDIFKTVALKISTFQVFSILTNLINDSEHEKKLYFLINSLPFNIFGEVLLALDTTALNSLNRIFTESASLNKIWLEEKITQRRKEFTDSCNHLTTQIDSICEQLREDSCGKNLEEGAINHIHDLISKVGIRTQQIKQIPLLFTGLIENKETLHLFTKSLIKAYGDLHIRLTSKEYYEGRPAGCVWGIIFRTIFETNNLEDEDEAIEIFAVWSILSPADYRDAGLLGLITDIDFSNLTPQQVFTRAKTNLELIGIKTIKDWKEKNIFNKNMLFNFLNRQENSTRLNTHYFSGEKQVLT